MEARPEARGGGLAAAAVRLTGAWILAGALGKLFLGTPKLLPAVVRDLTPFSLTTTFQAVIAVEIFLAALAFLKPRLAWPVLAALLVFFDWILTLTLQAGEKSCGCFGGSIQVSPWFMLAVDTLLLVFLVATAPWKRLWKPGAPLPWLIPAAAVAVLAPWLKIQADTGSSGPVAASGADNGSVGSAAEKPPPPRVDWVEWKEEPSAWIGRTIWDVTELTTYVDPGLLPAEGRVVLWRQGCAHCAEHLQQMKLADDGMLSILLVQIQDDLADARAVELMPEGEHVTHATFPEGLQFVLQTPWELRVEGGAITSVIAPEED